MPVTMTLKVRTTRKLRKHEKYTLDMIKAIMEKDGWTVDLNIRRVKKNG